MTDKTRFYLRGALQWGALFLPAFGGAWSIARAIGATKLDTVVYQSDRRADSLIHIGEQRSNDDWRMRIDHRTHVTLCKVSPKDSECEQ